MSDFSFPLQYKQAYITAADIVLEIPNLDTLKYFYRGVSTPTILSPSFNTHNIIDTSYMFYGCSSLRVVPLFDTSNVTNMNVMFQNCNSLYTVPLFDTSKVTNMSNMFNGCNNNLYTIPQLDTSNVTVMSSMFNSCSNLRAVPLFDTSNVTSMYNMFSSCSKLETIPLFDTSKVTDMSGMFQNCSWLREIPEINTTNVTTMRSIFSSCSYLRRLPKFYAGKLGNVSNFCGYGTLTNLIEIGGFENFGATSSISGTNSSYFIAGMPNLTKESVLNVLNNLYDRASVGFSVLTLKLHANHLAMLSDDEKAIATNKGWTLA